jgi:integrase
MALSVKAVAAAKMPGRYGDGKGLALVITKRGSRAWVYRYQLRGERHDMGLGPASEISLAAARDAAHQARLLIRAGQDPLAARHGADAARIADAAKARSFDQVLAEYLAAKADGWKNAQHRQQWESSIRRFVSPTLGGLSIAGIDKAHVISVLQPFWSEKPETANRVRGRIEQLINFAVARGYRPEAPNPARWAGHLEHAGFQRRTHKDRDHQPALPFERLPAFMAELAGRDDAAVPALALTILSASRTDETLSATWSEFDLEERVWTRPADHMKAEVEHKVPLTDAMIACLPPRGEAGGRVFPLGSGAMLKVCERMGHTDKDGKAITVHGFRSSFRDWAAERTNFPREVVEMALAHTIENKAEAAYRRGDLFAKRRLLMDAWERYAMTPAPAAGQVVTLAR